MSATLKVWEGHRKGGAVKRGTLVMVAVLALVVGAVVGVVGARLGGETATGGGLADLAEERGLTGQQAESALKTFVPPGEHDEYYMFASGGHSGQVLVIGVPSMRLLKEIPVFTPDAWQGYGYGTDQGNTVLEGGTNPDKSATEVGWGDAHHPGLSETEGDYDGRWLYINDRANGRIAMIDLADFKTKQIVDIPNISTSHGGVFVTPNTEYAHISSMTPMPVNGYADVAGTSYAENYRGFSSWMKVDEATGRLDVDESFQIELPPYTQDLADAGKLTSYGWGFINSYNTEMAIGGDAEGGEPLETGAIAADYDFLHIINWEKAAEVVAAGNYEDRGGMKVIPLDTAIAEGLLYFAPEPRNPHGVDVSPTGDYIVVSGKLDPNVTVFDFEKIQAAIQAQDFQGTDPFGVPILNFDSVVAGQVEVGVGPLHTQFDAEGHAYTSLFVDSAIAEWTLGTKAGVAEADAFKLVETIPVHYNIGHLVTAEGDTVAPDGRYMVALNKWSLDRFPNVGTLHPQNFQLIDLDSNPLEILYDAPIGIGEPHYVQMINTDKLTSRLDVYPVGTDPMTMTTSEFATQPGEERVEVNGDTVDVYMTAIRSHFTPDILRVTEGQTVNLHITNPETAADATHGFAVPQYNIEASIDPGEVVNISFTAERSGSFAFYCSEFCSALHLEMQGWLLVEPK
jgi:nitrous-oxide reductase